MRDLILQSFFTLPEKNMKSAFMGALADNKFNRILDNDLSESENVGFLIIQHFRLDSRSLGEKS